LLPINIGTGREQFFFLSNNDLWRGERTTSGAFTTTKIRDDLAGQFQLRWSLNESDGKVTASDISASYSLSIPFKIDEVSQIVEVDMTAAIRDALRAGKTRISFKVDATQSNLALTVVNALGAGASGNTTASITGTPLPATGQTALTIKPAAGVLGNLYRDREGQLELLAAGRQIADLRRYDAGTVSLEVSRPKGGSTSEPRNITIELRAPTPGASRPLIFDSDRDIIRGGEGNDSLLGNSDFDRLIGGNGADRFVADSMEPRDLVVSQDDLYLPLSNAAEGVDQFKTTQLDRMVTIADSNLRFLLAAALSIPVTRGFAGQTELARPIRASELSTLTSLDLSGRNITNLSGLGYATNLKFLNLSNNPNLTSISELKPRLSTEAADAGAALGLSQLRHLALDSTGVGDLSPLKQIDRLQGLTADY
ncbi:MAG: leucine-rich repeat domain-containing protein, partial [Planctomycetota bacterium]